MEYSDFLRRYKTIPQHLFRSFDKKEHMEAFLSGSIRLGYYQYYFHKPEEDWKWEDLIADPSLLKKNSRTSKYEGNIRQLQIKNLDGTYKTLDVLSHGSPHYSLSFSNEINNDYGPFVVQLNSPIEFHQRIQTFLNSKIGHYAGKMVYCNTLRAELNKYDSRLICLYSDSISNASKREFRFSYDILHSDGVLKLQNGDRTIPNGSIRYDNDPNVKELTLPHFCWLEGIKIDDLCTIAQS